MNFVDLARQFRRNMDAVPIVGHFRPEVGAGQRTRIAALAARIASEERNLQAIPPSKGDAAAGMAPGRTLTLEDHSAIQLAREHGSDQSLGYRALLLAQDGDIVALPGARNLDFEAYCRDVLDLGSIETILPVDSGPLTPLAVACAQDRRLVSRVAAAARENGGLTVLPYMATGGVWHLASAIAAESGVPVRVAGPPPNLGRAANDKVWFASLAAELLGRDAVPPSYAAYGMAALVGHLQQLARDYRSVAIKLTHSAASLGNLVFDAAEIAGMPARDLRNQLAGWMEAKGWTQPFPAQVCAWESPLIGSPSAQLWIPTPADGDPVVEGVFDQIVAGPEARFSGAEPSRLPQPWQARIAEEAMQLGLLLQALGWFGRCSFDAVLVEGQGEADAVHWVECNGRWGGVSIPMTLANRLVGDWRQSALLIVCRHVIGGRGMAVADFLAEFAAELFRAEQTDTGVVLLSPGHLESGTGIDLLVLARDREDALARASAITARLTS